MKEQKEEGLLEILTPTLRQFMTADFFVWFSQAGRVFMPLYLVRLGASPVDIGLLLTTAESVSLAMSLLGGWMSDSVGRLRAILLGNTAKALYLVVAILAGCWEWMFLAYALMSIGGALSGPSNSAFIAEETPEDHRAKVYAVRQNMMNLATIAGNPLAGLLVHLYGFRVMMGMELGAMLIAILLFAGLARRERKKEIEESGSKTGMNWESLRGSLGVLWGMLLAGGLFSWLFVTDILGDIFTMISMSFQGLYYEEVIGLSVGQIGLIPAIVAAIGLVVTIPVGYWVDKKGEHVGLAGAYLLLGFYLVILLNASSFAGVLAGVVVYTFALTLVGPSYESLVSKAVPEERRGIAFGLTSTSMTLIAMPMPLLGGYLWERFSPQTPFSVTLIACLPLSFLAWWKLRAPEGGEGAE